MTGHCHLEPDASSSSGDDDTNAENGMGLAAFAGDVTALPSCQLLQLIVPVRGTRAVQTNSSGPATPREWFCFSQSAQASVCTVRSIFLSFFLSFFFFLSFDMARREAAVTQWEGKGAFVKSKGALTMGLGTR